MAEKGAGHTYVPAGGCVEYSQRYDSMACYALASHLTAYVFLFQEYWQRGEPDTRQLGRLAGSRMPRGQAS